MKDNLIVTKVLYDSFISRIEINIDQILSKVYTRGSQAFLLAGQYSTDKHCGLQQNFLQFLYLMLSPKYLNLWRFYSKYVPK